MGQYPVLAAEPIKGESIAFSEDTIARALTNIYRKKFNVKKEIEPELFAETVHLLNLASATGISDAVDAGTPMPEDEFLQQIKTNNEVFSAFRVHKMQNDIAARMTDDKGQLKSFSQFAKDVKPYTDHQNRQWLRTEFNTAVLRAHQAADWQQFEAEKDVLPNLEWMPSTSVNPGADHRVFWGTILPIGHPFWDEHRPGDRWNCKCALRNTDKPGTGDPVLPTSKNDTPYRGLENNPGKDGKLISDKHPYFPDSCGTCPFAGNKLAALYATLSGKKKNCYACGKVEKVIAETDEQERLQKQYGKTWSVEQTRKNGGYIVVEQGHGESEKAQNVKSATPLAKDGMRVELIKQKTIRVDGQKKKTSTRDANVFDAQNIPHSKWEFKFTENYQRLSKSMGTKAAQAIEQGADVVLIDIVRTDKFSTQEVIDGVYNSFNYNKELQGMCVMIESREYMVISRDYFIGGQYETLIKKWLNSIN